MKDSIGNHWPKMLKWPKPMTDIIPQIPAAWISEENSEVQHHIFAEDLHKFWLPQEVIQDFEL